MNGQEHYSLAEKLVMYLWDNSETTEQANTRVAMAQVHALLALAAATQATHASSVNPEYK